MNEISLCIATHNRVDDLVRLLESALLQEPPVPIIVYDDASVDGTAAVVKRRFPTVKLIEGKTNVGVVAGRNICLREAETPYVMILDDDAYFASVRTVHQTLHDFVDPSIAAVAVPFVEGGVMMQGSEPGAEVELARSFIGAAHCLRRDAVLACGGLRESYRFYCEEPDIAIRLLAAGMVVRHGTADAVVHCPNADRNPMERRRKRWLSELRFKWINAPFLLLAPILAAHVRTLVIHNRRFGGMKAALSLGFSSAKVVAGSWHERSGVSLPIYRVWLRLANQPRLRMSELDAVPAIQKLRKAATRHDQFRSSV